VANVQTFENQVDTETSTTAVDGTDWITLVGTLLGIAVHSTITADGDDLMVINSDDGSEDTHDTGTTTAELEAHEVGITTVAGTKTNELTGTSTIAPVGTDWITLDGTESGNAVHSTITADDEE